MKNKKKRILFISGQNDGGAVISIYSTLCGLDLNQFEPVILFYRTNVYIDMFRKTGAKVLILEDIDKKLIEAYDRNIKENDFNDNSFLKKIKCFIPNLWLDIKVTKHGIKIINHEKIDLVHHNMFFSREMVAAGLFTHVPQVCHCRHFGTPSHSSKLLAKTISNYIYVSNAIRNHYEKHGIEKNKGQVIYEPIDTTIYCPSHDNTTIRKEFSIAKNTKIITNAGRITPWKGQDWFLEAMDLLIDSHPNVLLLIVGEAGSDKDDQNFYLKLQKIVNKGNLKGKVIFTGLRNDIAEIMSASDVVVHSAISPEPFGRVIAEAMATSTPVIATSEGGALEIIEHQETGLLVRPGDSKELANLVARLIDDAKFSNALAKNGKHFVENKFSLQEHIDQLQSLYKKNLQKKIA
jgi:glycosyltransferase involved in cell wall biosynthesis